MGYWLLTLIVIFWLYDRNCISCFPCAFCGKHRKNKRMENNIIAGTVCKYSCLYQDFLEQPTPAKPEGD